MSASIHVLSYILQLLHDDLSSVEVPLLELTAESGFWKLHKAREPHVRSAFNTLLAVLASAAIPDLLKDSIKQASVAAIACVHHLMTALLS